MSDYYRGSGSYVDAAKEQLKSLEVAANKRAIRKMNSDLRHDIQATTDAIQNAEIGIRNDIRASAFATLRMGLELSNNIQSNTNAIQDMATGLNSAIRDSTYEIIASQQMLKESIKQGFSAFANAMGIGFEITNEKLDAIVTELDAIHGILKNPLFTQSRELYRRALDNYTRGLYEEALEDCLGALEKNKTDFVSWYLLGHIYLFGAGKFSNVIDVDKAEGAFSNAAKYIDYDLGNSDEANVLGSEIYYYLGYTRLIKSNDLLVEKKKKESIKKLEEAEKASSKSYLLSEKNLVAMYEQAKELHFLGRNDESLQLIEKLIRADKNYAVRASNDKNFESLWSDIEALIGKLKNELCILIREVLEEVVNKNEVKISADEAKGDKLVKYFAEPLRKAVDSCVKKYKDLKIEKMDYFSVLNIQDQVYKDLKELQESIIDIMNNAMRKKQDDEDKERKERKRQQEEKKRIKWEEEERKREEQRRKEEEKERIKRKAEERKREEEERKQKAREKRRNFVLLLIAILMGFLLIRGCSSYLHSETHQTKLLFKAIRNDDVNKAEICIMSGANVNRKENDYTPLIYAVKNGQTKMVDFLIKSSADIHGSDKRGKQPIHLIMRKIGINDKTNLTTERLNILNLLIKSGADVNAKDIDGWTPLMYGVSSYDYSNNINEKERMETMRIQCIEKLIESGAKVNANYQDYISPEFQNRKKIINLLKSVQKR